MGRLWDVYGTLKRLVGTTEIDGKLAMRSLINMLATGSKITSQRRAFQNCNVGHLWLNLSHNVCAYGLYQLKPAPPSLGVA